MHFLASILLALLLVFFAVTGFMAEHRSWFHERIDRALLADDLPLRAPCSPEALEAALPALDARPEALAATGGAPSAARRGTGAWELGARAPDAPLRLRCLDGASVAWVAQVIPLADLGPPGRRWRDVVVDRFGGHWDQVEVRGLDPAEGEIARAATVWRTTTAQRREAEGVALAFTRRWPAAHALIELHRGRGSTARLLDVTAALTVVVSLSGVAHGLRYPGRRRRVLLALLVASAALVAVLLAG